MPIRDNELIFATATSPTTTNICLASNIWDSGPLASGSFPTGPYANLLRDLGAGEKLVLEILITTVGLSAATASQVNFQLVTASASDLTSFTVMSENAAAAAPTYTVGTRIRLPFPSSGSWRRYVGVNCQITLGVLSTLAYSAYVLKEVDSYRAYAPGFKLDA